MFKDPSVSACTEEVHKWPGCLKSVLRMKTKWGGLEAQEESSQGPLVLGHTPSCKSGGLPAGAVLVSLKVHFHRQKHTHCNFSSVLLASSQFYSPMLVSPFGKLRE